MIFFKKRQKHHYLNFINTILLIVLVALISGGAVFLAEEVSKKEMISYIESLKIEINKKNNEKEIKKSEMEIVLKENKELIDELDKLNLKIVNYVKNAKDAYVENGSVIYDDGSGKKIILSNFEKNYYISAKISPNKNFIALLWTKDDDIGIDIYDIDKKKYEPAEKWDMEFYWTEDSRLVVVGSCNKNTSCGLHESINFNEPWKLREIKKIF